MLRRFLGFAIICMLAVGSLAAAQRAGVTLTLSGKVTSASGKHPVHIALWDAAGFLTKASQEIIIKPQATPEFQFHIPPGTWAVSAYEDTNENGVLDMGMFGPKEPSGFWRAFHAWRKPRFSDVCSSLTQDTRNADIQLH